MGWAWFVNDLRALLVVTNASYGPLIERYQQQEHAELRPPALEPMFLTDDQVQCYHLQGEQEQGEARRCIPVGLPPRHYLLDIYVKSQLATLLLLLSKILN